MRTTQGWQNPQMGPKTPSLAPWRYQEMKAGVCYWETLQKVPPHTGTLLRGWSLRRRLQENGERLWLFLIKDSGAVDEAAQGGREVSTAAGL